MRQKAGDIRTQSEKLRALIEDLNLTSKLQYGAQPLRRQPVQAGPLLRRLAAEFCESPLAAGCDMAVELPPDADKAVLHADAALLGRAVENLLNNAARHNAPGVHITLAGGPARKRAGTDSGRRWRGLPGSGAARLADR